MALANYTDLKASIATWLPRADLTTSIPDCILMAEAEFNDRLRKNEARVNFTISGEYVTAPNDFQEFRSGYIDTSPRIPLAYRSPDMQTATHGSCDTRVQNFSLAGGSFRFDPLVATGDEVILYYASIPPLATNATNWLLTKHPQLYLMTSLYYGSILIKDAEGAAGYKRVYEDMLNQIDGAAKRARWGGPGMAMRAA